MYDSNNRLVRRMLIVGAVISLLPQVALAFYAFPSADDYCVAVPPRDGFWQAQMFWYTSWTGRYAAMFVETVVSRWDLARIYPWFVLTTLAGTGLAVRSVIIALDAASRRRSSPNVAALIATAVFAGGLPSTVEAFYWMPSALSYQWGLVLFGFWTALLITQVTGPVAAKGRALRRTVLVVLTLLLPGFNEVMAPLVFAVLLGSILFNRRRGRESHRFLLMLLVILIVLTAVSFLAPGNSVRSQTYPDLPTRFNLAYSLTETGRQTIRFMTRFSTYPALWLAGAAVWWWRRAAGPSASVATPRSMVVGLGLFFALMYLTLFPLYWVYGSVNYTGEGRTHNVTYVPLVVGIIMVAAFGLSSLVQRYPNLLRQASARHRRVDVVLACALAILLVAAPSTRRAARALVVAPQYAESQRKREARLRDSTPGSTVLVSEMTVRPEGLFWGDLQPDEDHWINRCVADYYRLKAVRTRR